MAQENFSWWSQVVPTILVGGGAGFYTGTYQVTFTASNIGRPLVETGVIDGSTASFETLNWFGVPIYFMGFTHLNEPVLSSATDGSAPVYIVTNTFYPHGSITYIASAPGMTYPYCFAEGTLISTPSGEAKVQDLSNGNLITTQDGRAVPVKWVGRQTLRKWRHGAHMQPVRIRAGALGNGLPHTDLTVTADHGMVIDGMVINASALVNGHSIDFVPMDELEDSFTVYHIETEAHDVILANGAPSETFVDAVTRSHFDNYQEYLDLYGAERIIREMPLPRIASARLVPQEIKDRLGYVGKSSLKRTA